MEHTIKLEIHNTTSGKLHVDAKKKKGTFKTWKASFDLESLPAKIQVDKYPLTIAYAADSLKNREFDLLAEVRSPISVAEDLIEELYQSLNKLGIKIFYDKESLEWGDNWKDRILNGTKKAEFAIIVISQNFFDREWTERELNEFINRQNRNG